jgi:hypothetical protein
MKLLVVLNFMIYSLLNQGVPDDVMPGILGETEPLPEFPLFGMVSSKGSKVRLTLKLEADEVRKGCCLKDEY